MTDSPPKRATWRLTLALVLAGVMGLAGGSLLALDHVTRKERELGALRQATRKMKELAARLELKGGYPAVEAVVARLAVGEIDSAALAALVHDGVREAALVRLRVEGEQIWGRTSLAWVSEPGGELASLFPESKGLEVSSLASPSWHAVAGGLGPLDGVTRRGVAVPSRTGMRVESDAVHVPVVAGLYLASPSPVLLLLVVELTEPVPSVLDHLQWMLRSHENE